MDQVKGENNANYKILLSGSTRENVRDGNPYEIDNLIQYDISATVKFLKFLPVLDV